MITLALALICCAVLPYVGAAVLLLLAVLYRGLCEAICLMLAALPWALVLGVVLLAVVGHP